MNTVVKGMLLAAAMLLPLFLSPSDCLAGAWTQQQGKLYERFSMNYYFADDQFDGRENRTDFPAQGKFTDTNIGNYLEYGIIDRLTVINSISYKRIEKKDDLQETRTYGIGDIDLGLKYRLAEGSWGVLSTQALVKIPEAYDKNDKLPLGNGQYDAEVRLLYGRSLWPYIPGYCGLEAGYRWRFDDPSDEFRYLVEFGMDFTKDLYGRIKLDGILSMDNGSRFDVSGNPTISNNFDLAKLDITVGCKISKAWGLEAEYMPAIYGKNTAAGATYTIALTYQIK